MYTIVLYSPFLKQEQTLYATSENCIFSSPIRTNCDANDEIKSREHNKVPVLGN